MWSVLMKVSIATSKDGEPRIVVTILYPGISSFATNMRTMLTLLAQHYGQLIKSRLLVYSDQLVRRHNSLTPSLYCKTMIMCMRKIQESISC